VLWKGGHASYRVQLASNSSTKAIIRQISGLDIGEENMREWEVAGKDSELNFLTEVFSLDIL
jgi:hypothetical protein